MFLFEIATQGIDENTYFSQIYYKPMCCEDNNSPLAQALWVNYFSESSITKFIIPWNINSFYRLVNLKSFYFFFPKTSMLLKETHQDISWISNNHNIYLFLFSCCFEKVFFFFFFAIKLPLLLKMAVASCNL